MQPYSIIIPALNEQDDIATCIQHLRALNSSAEIIVADGGSSDQTAAAAEQEGALVVASQSGRGVQCNAGARQAKGDILLFVHADTFLPDNAFEILNEYFEDPNVDIGTFRLRFDDTHWFLKLCGYCTRFDSVFTRFGDQGIVVRRSFYDTVGGFPEWPLFEDVDFLSRARKQRKLYSFPTEVVTSARNFRKNGIIRQQVKNGWLIAKYLMGVPPARLAEEYRR